MSTAQNILALAEAGAIGFVGYVLYEIFSGKTFDQVMENVGSFWDNVGQATGATDAAAEVVTALVKNPITRSILSKLFGEHRRARRSLWVCVCVWGMWVEWEGVLWSQTNFWWRAPAESTLFGRHCQIFVRHHACSEVRLCQVLQCGSHRSSKTRWLHTGIV